MTKLLALFCAGIAAAQAPATGRLVLVDVLVRNKTAAVAGLTKDDFTLTDKGKPQKIDVFLATADRDPNAKLTPLSPGVGSNRLNTRGETARSATVILFDRINTPAADQAFVRKQVLALLSSLKDSDRIGFYSLGRTLTMVHDFTDDPSALVRAASRISAGTAAPVGDLAEGAMQKSLQDALTAEQDIDATFRVTATSQAFQSIARHLSGIPGRKNLAWIARTFPLTFGNDANRRGELDKELNGPTVILQEENVALYPISPGGVGTGQSDTSTSTAATNTGGRREGSLLRGANSSTNESGALSDSATMQTVAEATGGVAYYNLNEITTPVRKVIEEAQYSYTLGFYPDAKLDGRMHDLNVKLAKKPETNGATVRYRKKYLASAQDLRKQTPSVEELALDPLEATAVTVAAVAQLDPAKAGMQKIDVSVNVNDLHFDRREGKLAGGFELGIYADGTQQGGKQNFNLNLTEDQVRQAAANGLIVGSTIPAASQPAKLRVVVRDFVSGSAGSVRIPSAVK